MRGWIGVVGLAVTIGAANSSVSAQVRPIELDTVRVEVASRSLWTLGAAARSVEIVRGDDLRKLPAQSVAEALRWATGVDLMPRSPALVDVGIRGSSFEQVLVLVDGIRVRDSQTGHFNLDTDVPLAEVERIEVLRGSASALYGSDALAGVINIITRSGGRSTSASAAAGSFERITLGADHRAELAGIAYGVGGSWDRSDGHRPGTDFEVALLRGSARLPVGGQDLDIAVGHARRDFGADGFYGAYPSFESTRTTTVSARSSVATGPVTWLPDLRLRRHSDDFILYRDDPARYRNQHSTTQIGGDLIGQVAVPAGMTLSAGVHGYQDRVQSKALGDRDESFLAGSMEAAWSSPGASGSAGLRADRLPDGSSAWNPSLSAAVWAAPWLQLHAAGGSAFRSPTWTERYYRDPVNVGSPDLEPERAWTAEVGASVYPTSRLSVSGTLWLRDAEDLIDWARPSSEPSAVWMTRNVDDARFTGVEARATWSPVPTTTVTLATSLLHLDDSSAAGWDSKYALRPETEVTGLSLQQKAGPVSLRLDGNRRRRTGEDAYFLLDGRVGGDVGRLLLHADLLNALDQDYLDIGRLKAAGRSLLIGAEVQID